MLQALRSSRQGDRAASDTEHEQWRIALRTQPGEWVGAYHGAATRRRCFFNGTTGVALAVSVAVVNLGTTPDPLVSLDLLLLSPGASNATVPSRRQYLHLLWR